MVKRISLFFVSVLVCQLALGKSVDEQSAKMIGYNFFRNEGIQVDPSLMTLSYKTTSVINGAAVTDFYVFNTGNTGFVMISGDDNVKPVLAYSTESAFDAAHIPASVDNWITIYKKEINYVIEQKIAASAKTAAQWDALQNGVTTRTAGKTTATTAVLPLLKTFWNQSPYYNGLCPFDASADTNAITGCVATAMAQVMKYWKWPNVGVGAHSYSSPYGPLSATFSSAVYKWDSMPNAVSKTNNFVATIMLHAGISVNMNYGVTASGAFVTSASSPITNCAEYALKTYFNYKNTIQGVSRFSYSDSDWVYLIEDELDNKRPVLHTGDGAAGGHCFVVDGYTTACRLHINWGWGGYYNGYYSFDNLAPGTETFNSNQTLVIGITPNNPAILGINEVAGNDGINIYPNPADDIINIDLQGKEASNIQISDMQGRQIKNIIPTNTTAIVTVPVSDLSAGMYLVTLQTQQGTVTRKIVVAK